MRSRHRNETGKGPVAELDLIGRRRSLFPRLNESEPTKFRLNAALFDMIQYRENSKTRRQRRLGMPDGEFFPHLPKSELVHHRHYQIRTKPARCLRLHQGLLQSARLRSTIGYFRSIQMELKPQPVHFRKKIKACVRTSLHSQGLNRKDRREAAIPCSDRWGDITPDEAMGRNASADWP